MRCNLYSKQTESRVKKNFCDDVITYDIIADVIYLTIIKFKKCFSIHRSIWTQSMSAT